MPRQYRVGEPFAEVMSDDQTRKEISIISSIEVEGETAICVGEIEIPSSIYELDEGVGKEFRPIF
jgi:hypothetical protein